MKRMWKWTGKTGAALSAAVVLAASPCVAAAEDNGVAELKKKVEVLAEEVGKLKAGTDAGSSLNAATGAGASKIYGAEKGISLGGYAELNYSSYLDDTKKDLADALRVVLYTGYRFTDKIVFNTEIEFEHADETFIEFAYVDFLLNPAFNLRPGLVLVPVGIINERHEPTTYNGVLRPDIESKIIPTTWRDIGVMAHGTIGGVAYKAAVLNGMKSDGFRKSDWIRNGRHKGTSANAENLAYVLNLEYTPADGVSAGGSYYHGGAGTGKGADAVAANEAKTDVILWEAHAVFKRNGFDLRGLYVQGRLNGNDAFKSSPPGDVGKKVKGWYAEAAYDVMPLLKPATEMSLSPFVRHEDYDTHAEVFTGSRDASQHRKVTTIGLSYKPVPNVAVKADYQVRDTDSVLPEGKGTGLDENKIDQINLGIGVTF